MIDQRLLGYLYIIFGLVLLFAFVGDLLFRFAVAIGAFWLIQRGTQLTRFGGWQGHHFHSWRDQFWHR